MHTATLDTNLTKSLVTRTCPQNKKVRYYLVTL